MTKREPFSEQIKRLIEASGETRYTICKETGVDQSTMSRFMSGIGGISIENLDRLADYLQWKIVVDRSAGRKRRK